MERSPHITVRDLTLASDEYVVFHDVSFTVGRGDVFVIMGASGCGKSALLNAMIGLVEPTRGEVSYDDRSFTHAMPEQRRQMLQRFGVLFQLGALVGRLTLAENVALPLREFTHLDPREIRELAEIKLGLVGLGGFSQFYPDEVSGSVQKRAALARAIALDPDILFLDEPTAEMGPLGARWVDDLITEVRVSMNTTIVSVTQDLTSIFATANDGIYLDAWERTVTARGNPKEMLASPPNPHVRAFLTRSPEKEVS
jgi:phospholipid/cholesterol/gamma-HCH transport system ATP-binding protein